MAIPSSAYDGDWKARSHLLPQCVVTSWGHGRCRSDRQVNPSSKTMAEWKSYLQADKHAKGKDTVKQYVTKTYRDSIKSANKAAEKFAEVPEQDLLEDIRAFLIKGAKDGDAPASCS